MVKTAEVKASGRDYSFLSDVMQNARTERSLLVCFLAYRTVIMQHWRNLGLRPAWCGALVSLPQPGFRGPRVSRPPPPAAVYGQTSQNGFVRI